MLFDDNMYQFGTPQASFWEATAGDVAVDAPSLASTESCDVAIIGGGYTGLSAAYHLARDYDIDVRVLDAGHIGWGASGRNGGFCGPGGSALGLEQMFATYGIDAVRHFYQVQNDAVNLVRELIEGEQIDSPMQGDIELCAGHSQKAQEHLEHEAAQFNELLDVPMEVYSADEFRERFFDSAQLFGGIGQPPAFGIHPLRYARGLAAAAVRRGAQLHAHSEVTDWSRDGAVHVLETAGGELRAKRVIFATNGFMPEHLDSRFAGVPLPIISAIIVTRPLTDDELAAHHWTTENVAINSRELMNYFRLLPDRRFMFGGRGHSNGDKQSESIARQRLESQLVMQWPKWKNVDVEYFWHGLICMTRRLTPCIGRLDDDPSVFYGFGYHGNGVNNSSWTGKQLADWAGASAMDERSVPESIPVLMRGLSAPFPMPALRLQYLRAALTAKRLKDKFG